MRKAPTIVGLVAAIAWNGCAVSQSADPANPANPPQPQAGAACPPDVRGNAPTVGGPTPPPNLSDTLADSKGVICPPAGVDPEMHVPPPGGGELKVIPPPGSPGGNPNVVPK